jgi:polyhydroxyalkanoate synthesis regulator phasin
LIDALDGQVKEGFKDCNETLAKNADDTKASLDEQCEDYKKRIEELKQEINRDIQRLDDKIGEVTKTLGETDAAQLAEQVASLESQVARL